MKGAASDVAAFGGSVENRVMSGSPHCLGKEDNIGECPTAFTWVDKSICIRGEAGVHCEGQWRTIGPS